MDFLRKHHEKVLLALALLTLIGTAGYLALKVDNLTKQTKVGGQRPPPRDDIKTIDLSGYKSTLEALQTPFLWTHPASNIFGISPFVPPPPTNTNVFVEVKLPLELVELRVRRSKILFRAYSQDPVSTEVRNIQINFVDKDRTYFIPNIGDSVPDSPYRVAKFEHKIEKVKVQGIGLQEKDVSQVILEAEGQEPIVLIVNQVAAPNPVAVLRCVRQPAAPFEVKRDQAFECAGESYKVVDINSTQVIILRTKTGEQLVLPPSPTTP